MGSGQGVFGTDAGLQCRGYRSQYLIKYGFATVFFYGVKRVDGHNNHRQILFMAGSKGKVLFATLEEITSALHPG